MISVHNLESGMPSAPQAVSRLRGVVAAEKARGSKAFKIIHGYGSTGTGGVLRTELRRALSGHAAAKRIKGYIPGEDFSIFSAAARAALLEIPELKKDRDLERHNPGITIVLL